MFELRVYEFPLMSRRSRRSALKSFSVTESVPKSLAHQFFYSFLDELFSHKVRKIIKLNF